jgi:hypothetical protein
VTAVRRGPDRAGPDRVRDDAGGVWIKTGWVVGLIVYAGVVLAWHAGFTAAAPFVVIPAVLVLMIGAGNLVGGRRPGRPAPRFNRPDLDPVPLPARRGDGTPTAADHGADGPPAGEPGTGR